MGAPAIAEAATCQTSNRNVSISYGTTSTTQHSCAEPSPTWDISPYLSDLVQAMAADLKSTAARLRRTFQYPTDDSSNDNESADVMDEEEQESLITSLAAQNAERNAQFRKYLLALPVLAAIPYIPALFHTKTFLLAVLALSSLGSTGYLLWQLPPDVTGIPLLDAWTRPIKSGIDGFSLSFRNSSGSGIGTTGYGGIATGLGKNGLARRRASSFSVHASALKSPLETWLPVLNAGLCGILVLMGLLIRHHDGSPSRIGVGIGNLPTIVYGVVLVAKMVMATVDPERELGELRYEYKGA